MSVVNPYESPAAELTFRPHAECVRQGDRIFVPRGYDLPPRCIRCNAPAQAPIRLRTLWWHSPALYALIVIGVLIYAIVAVIVRKRFQVSPGLCDVHAAQRSRTMALGLGVGFASLIGMFVAMASDIEGAAIWLTLLSIVAFVITMYRVRLVYPKRIDDRGALLAGFGQPFLASIAPAIRR